jgi:hypothetical protein
MHRSDNVDDDLSAASARRPRCEHWVRVHAAGVTASARSANEDDHEQEYDGGDGDSTATARGQRFHVVYLDNEEVTAL